MNGIYTSIYFQSSKVYLSYVSHICRQAYKSNCPICYSNKHLCAIFFVRRLADKIINLSWLVPLETRERYTCYVCHYDDYIIITFHLAFFHIFGFYLIHRSFSFCPLSLSFCSAAQHICGTFNDFALFVYWTKFFWENQLQLIVFNIDSDLFVE